MDYFKAGINEVLSLIGSSRQGLTRDEALLRLKQYGKNVLSEGKKKTALQIFAEQFKDLLVIILVVAAIISMISGETESTAVIFAVIILNAILGTVQYLKAEKSLTGLKRLSSPVSKVIRQGIKTEIPSEDIVPGDILLLEAGDLVTADARILNNYSLKVNESSLTGESEPVEKTADTIKNDVPLADRKNMVYSGSLVTYGRAEAVVTSTAMGTELGKIASLLNRTEQRKTPLQKSLDKFSKNLAIIIICICVLVFVLSIYRKEPPIDSLLFAVALAVAAIPEALGSIVTIVLAMGTHRMAKENAIMKELKAAESLGSVSVICSDKTGTLTKNKMEVQDIYTLSGVCSYKEINPIDTTHYMLLKEAVLVTDADVSGEKEIGDPTETALLNMAEYLGINTLDYKKMHPRLGELAFDSERKLMSALYEMNNENVILTKGALDVIMSRVIKVLTPNGTVDLTDSIKNDILSANEEFSKKGLRVLAFAMRSIGDKTDITLEDETSYTFIGLISMMDPPRDEAVRAVSDASLGGIKTIMITGDHKITASAIAKNIGIMKDGDIALEGRELDNLSDGELLKKLDKVTVYARVSPEHKIRIVDAWQRKGHLVSMTGDGVNDAPALKKADIGVAMGVTGTEVAKDAASMILTDDNFATIVKAVVNGRSMYANIKHAIEFLLSGNMAGILCVLFASLGGFAVPFLPVHLLFINLLTDSLPALAIGMEKGGDNLLAEPPRDINESVLNTKTVTRIGIWGLLIGTATMVSYFEGLKESPDAAMTMAFITLTLSRLFHGFNCRSDESVVKIGIKTNLYSVGAFLLGVLLLGAVIFIPVFSRIFSIAHLSIGKLLFITVAAFVPTVLIQLCKIIKFNNKI